MLLPVQLQILHIYCIYIYIYIILSDELVSKCFSLRTTNWKIQEWKGHFDKAHFLWMKLKSFGPANNTLMTLGISVCLLSGWERDWNVLYNRTKQEKILLSCLFEWMLVLDNRVLCLLDLEIEQGEQMCTTSVPFCHQSREIYVFTWAKCIYLTEESRLIKAQWPKLIPGHNLDT